MSGSVVVDASLAVKWLVEEDDSDKAHAALQSWVAQDITRIAPHLMPFEVANALHRRVLRGELNVTYLPMARGFLYLAAVQQYGVVPTSPGTGNVIWSPAPSTEFTETWEYPRQTLTRRRLKSLSSSLTGHRVSSLKT